jgi:hypothetical protein
MNETGPTSPIILTDENLLSQILAELISLINQMNETGPTDENQLSQIPVELISLINQINESTRSSHQPTHTPPLTPMSEESEQQYNVFEELENCVINQWQWY